MAVWTVQIHSKFLCHLAVWWSVYCFLLIFRGTSLTISNMASLWLNSQICSTKRLFGAIIPADFTAVFVVRKSVSKLAVALIARRYAQQSRYNVVNCLRDGQTDGRTDWHRVMAYSPVGLYRASIASRNETEINAQPKPKRIVECHDSFTISLGASSCKLNCCTLGRLTECWQQHYFWRRS